jgi:hypothetical protein
MKGAANMKADHYFYLGNDRSVYAYRNILGIGPDLAVYGGYDDKMIDPDGRQSVVVQQESTQQLLFNQELSSKDKLAIAEIMIRRWAEFRDKAFEEE